mmetsp:Transcript_2672/g.4566  ORF Transcript_2672/g.4566 Transcript_2672/m.4566 type:complete len:97 (-) Transcript_2672:160-450(-)
MKMVSAAAFKQPQWPGSCQVVSVLCKHVAYWTSVYQYTVERGIEGVCASVVDDLTLSQPLAATFDLCGKPGNQLGRCLLYRAEPSPHRAIVAHVDV